MNTAQPSAPHAEQANQIEMEHSIGFNGRYNNTLHYHPTDLDTLVYSNGGLLVIEKRDDKHK